MGTKTSTTRISTPTTEDDLPLHVERQIDDNGLHHIEARLSGHTSVHAATQLLRSLQANPRAHRRINEALTGGPWANPSARGPAVAVLAALLSDIDLGIDPESAEQLGEALTEAATAPTAQELAAVFSETRFA